MVRTIVNALIVMAASFTIASCTKKASPSGAKPETWTVSDITSYNRYSTVVKYYNPAVGDSLIRYVFSEDTGHYYGLYIDFLKPPAAGNTYKLVYAPKTDKEASVGFQTNSDRGGTEDNKEQYIQVTGEGSKLRFIATEIEIKHYTFVVDWTSNLSLNVSY